MVANSIQHFFSLSLFILQQKYWEALISEQVWTIVLSLYSRRDFLWLDFSSCFCEPL